MHPAALEPTAFGLHVSVVHWLPSLQSVLFGVPAHTPPPHVSFWVHDLPSLQATVLFVCVQPESVHVSLVHGFPSLHREWFGVPWHWPAPQTSVCVHATPSLHETVLLVCPQPVLAEQVSVVHTLLSSQAELTGVPTHVPAEQLSVVHATPSEHEFELSFGYEQPEAVQMLSVQALPSLQRELSST
jgi:hypothetical protein